MAAAAAAAAAARSGLQRVRLVHRTRRLGEHQPDVCDVAGGTVATLPG